MIKDRVVLLFDAINSKPTGSRGQWVLGHCPMGPWKHGGKDAHPSFGIKVNTKGKSICKCMSCGYGGDLESLLMDLRYRLSKKFFPGYNLATAHSLVQHEFADLDIDLSGIPDYGEGGPERTPLVPFPESWLSKFPCATTIPLAMDYLADRGVGADTARTLELKFDVALRRIGFPVRDHKGVLMGMQGRTVVASEETRYKQYLYKDAFNSPVWMGEHLMDLDKPLVLLEGPFDFTSVYRAYPNVAASFTSGLSYEKVLRVSDATEIITFYDHGKGGDAARERISKALPKTPIHHIIPSAEHDDAGAMDFDTVREYLQEHVVLP